MTIDASKNICVSLVLCCCLTGPALGQKLDPEHQRPSPAYSFDTQLLLDVYHTRNPLLKGTLQVADWSSYPLFVVTPLVVGSAGWQRENMGMERAAYRALLAETAAFVGASVSKHLFRRMRPYQRMPSLWGRLNWIDRTLLNHSPYSMPSGHAAISFAMATSFTLSYPYWHIAAPAYLWALAISGSRVWIGAHYPSDILLGALLGIAAGVGVHLFRAHITPPFLKGGESLPTPAVQIQLKL